MTSTSLNPAQFLSREPTSSLEHNCLEHIVLQTKVREDLDDTPLPHGRMLFVDGSSRVVEGVRASGYVVTEVTTQEKTDILEKGQLPPTRSAQHCEVYALDRGLNLLEGD